MSVINFIVPFTFLTMITSVGISVIYFAIKNYRSEPEKTFDTFIASFILFIVGLVVFLYGADGFWKFLNY